MPKAGQPQRITFERRDLADAVVAGKDLADFDFPAWLDGDPIVLAVSDFEDLTGGKYAVTLTMPATLGWLRVDCDCLDPTTDTLDPEVLEGRVTANDIDSAAVLAARPPSVTLASNVSPQSAFTIKVHQGDGITLRIPIYDQDGELEDLSLWQNFRFSIQNTLQTVVGSDLPYHQTTGITGGADGFLVVELPEGCSAYDTHPVGHTDTKHWWSADANLIADTATKTRTLRAGPFVITSKETPSP